MPETTLSETQAFKYWAFISYSQRDKESSKWLSDSIETYRVPHRLVGRRSRDGKVPRRLFPVFRDREELPTSADLNANIAEALRASRYLIVVCSPNGAASRWVNEEIRTFKAMGREDRVLAIIVDGEPNVSDKPDSGVPECFPEALRYRMGNDGNLTQERTEPIAADVRPDRDGRYNARLKIIAGLLGVGFDELRRRELARRRRRIILGAAAAIAMVGALAGTWIWQERAKKRDVDRQLALKYEERARRLAEKRNEPGAALFFAKSNELEPTRTRRDAALLHIQELVLPRLSVEHGEKVTWVAFAPDGGRFLTMSDKGTLRVWNSESAAQLVEFHVDNDTYSFRKALFTRDGKRIFTALENARLWNAEDGKPIASPIPFHTIKLGGGGVTESSYVERAGLDPAEKKIVLKWNENFVQSWDANTSLPLGQPEQHTGGWTDLAYLWQDDPIPQYSPDAKLYLVWDIGGPMQLKDIATGKEIGDSLSQEGGIAAAFSPKSDRLVTGGLEGMARIWTIAARRDEPIRSFTRMIHPSIVSLIKFSPDGEFILTICGATAYLWNRSGQLEMVMPASAEIEAATFSPDNQSILTGSQDGTAFIWKVAERRALPRPIASAAWKGVRLMVLSPDGRSFFTQRNSHLGLWDVRTGKLFWEHAENEPELTAVAFSPDGSIIATVDHAPIPRNEPYKFGEDVPEKKILRLWNAKTGMAVGEPYEINGTGRGDSETPEMVVAFGSDGSRMLLIHNGSVFHPGPDGGGLTAQATLQLLDGRTARPMGEHLLLTGHFTSALFLKSGDILLAHGDEVLRWPTGDNKPSTDPLLQAQYVLSIALSPDEKTLLTVSRSSGRLWDMKSRRPIGAVLEKPGMTEIHNAAFSPDGRIALTTDNNVIRLWDSQTGEAMGQPFPLGDFPMFGQTPRFVDGGHLLACDRSVVWDKDISWLLGDVSPDRILNEAQLFSRRRVRPDGDAGIIPAAEWKAMRR